MIPHAYLVHGFNDRTEGGTGVDLLAGALKTLGYQPIQVDYGWTGRIGVRMCNKRIASALSGTIHWRDIAIGHSNGCAIIHLATHHPQHPAPFSRLIYVNPALDADAELAPSVKRLDVFHDPSDFWPSVASWIPWSPWGAMGSVGYEGTDKRIINHEHCHGHGGLFREDIDRILGLISDCEKAPRGKKTK